MPTGAPRTLVLWRPSERDPTNRVIDETLKTLPAQGSAQEFDCQDIKTEQPSDCALKAFALRKPFEVRFYREGVDSFGFFGFTGDANGRVSQFDHDSVG
jgi:hypothetical protein